MKLLFSGDHHFDADGERLDECIRIHEWMVTEARTRAVDAFVSCGDIYERASTPVEREAVSSWLVQMADVCPVYVVKGNHDRHLDCAIMGKLKAKHPIVVCEGGEVRRVGDVALGLIAWPERARILQAAHADPDAEASAALRALFAGIGQELAAHPGPRIVAGHLMIDGAETSVGQPLLGQPMRVGLLDLTACNASLVVAGHIHMPQHWQLQGTTVMYTGSPYRTSFGEMEEKSVVLVSTDGPTLEVKRIVSPCAGMVLISERWQRHDPNEAAGDFEGSLAAHVQPEALRGADVRLRYEVNAEDRELARASARRWHDALRTMHARSVKLEEVLCTASTARAPEVARATTLPDKLMAMWTARQSVPEEERRLRLLTKAGELETR